MKILQNFVAFSEYMNFKVAKIFFLFYLQFHQALLKFDFMKVLTKLCWALGQSPLARKKALRGHFEAVSCIIELEVHWPFHPVQHYLSENRAVGKSRAFRSFVLQYSNVDLSSCLPDVISTFRGRLISKGNFSVFSQKQT